MESIEQFTAEYGAKRPINSGILHEIKIGAINSAIFELDCDTFKRFSVYQNIRGRWVHVMDHDRELTTTVGEIINIYTA